MLSRRVVAYRAAGKGQGRALGRDGAAVNAGGLVLREDAAGEGGVAAGDEQPTARAGPVERRRDVGQDERPRRGVEHAAAVARRDVAAEGYVLKEKGGQRA